MARKKPKNDRADIKAPQNVEASTAANGAVKTTVAEKVEACENGPTAGVRTVNDRFEKYLQPQFTQKLIEHLHRAKKKALAKKAKE